MSQTGKHPERLSVSLTFDRVINYAFQQNAIPVIKELFICNDTTPRKNLTVRVTTQPDFADPLEFRLQALASKEEHRVSVLDLKLSPSFLAQLNEKVSGLLRVEVLQEGKEGTVEGVLECVASATETISLLAHNEWCGLVTLPEILAAFVLPNDPAIMPLLGRAAEILGVNTGRSALNGYQDKSRKRAWEQIAAIYKAVAEVGLRYISPPASFENTGQKVRFPSEILARRFGTCLDLSLLFAACCEQAGLHPLLLLHQGHMYAGCWLEDRTLPEPAIDDLQQVRKFSEDALTAFEATLVTESDPGNLKDAERLARPHLETQLPFRMALDIRRARMGRIHPLPIPGYPPIAGLTAGPAGIATRDSSMGSRDFIEPAEQLPRKSTKPVTRIDQWKNKLLDLSLRNRLLNFKPTKSTIPILSSSPEQLEDELAAEKELSFQPKPKVMGGDDPRQSESYTRQQRVDAVVEHLRDQLKQGRIHSGLDEPEHSARLTELYRAARLALEENGTNTLFASVGVLEWRETEHSDRILRAPILLVPVELKRKSVLEGFSLRRIDEETRLNVTLMEMLRQQFEKDIPGLDPLPEDSSGVDVPRVFQIFREAVRDLPGWEVKSETWLSQFSFTKFLLWKDLADRLEYLTRNRIVNHLVNDAGSQYPNSSDDIRPEQLDDRFHPQETFCPRSADSSQLAAVLAAAAGHDFVLEGPPGTGKSQTITNIIAQCLASGKRVLFVAEKRAALEVVHRRLREEGLAPFCLELHSNKSGKSEVIAQFDASLKFVTAGDGQDWGRRTAELEKLRSTLNGYTRCLHQRQQCGLSAYQCLDYLLPRKSEPWSPMDQWPDLINTASESLEIARELAQVLQDRARNVMPLAGHPLKLLNCEEWSPAWAERTLEATRNFGLLAEAAIQFTAELSQWLKNPRRSSSLDELLQLKTLVECLLNSEPVGPAFATTSWGRLKGDLEYWMSLARERVDLRAKIAPFIKEQESFSSCSDEKLGSKLTFEEWPAETIKRVLSSGREILEFVNEATECSRELHAALGLHRGPDSRTKLVRLVELVDILLGPLPVGPAFATLSWEELNRLLDQCISLIRQRSELRVKLKGYDENKLLLLDLESLDREWDSCQSSWFIIKLLRSGRVRFQLRSARTDNVTPESLTVSVVLKTALQLRSLNASIINITPAATESLGQIWAAGEIDVDSLILVRSWGESLHARMAACAVDDPNWLVHLRGLLSEFFKLGLAAWGPGTIFSDRLKRYREAVTRFDEAFNGLDSQVGFRRSILDSALDHLGAVEAAIKRLIQTAPRIRVIGEEFSSIAPLAQECLGHIWNKGEPVVDEIFKARVWGERLHASLLGYMGDDLDCLNNARQMLAQLFNEGASACSPGTPSGDRLLRYREAFLQFQTASNNWASELHIERSFLNESPDHFSAIRSIAGQVISAWPQLRHWCAWQKVRHQAVRIGLAPIVVRLESAEGPPTNLPSLFENSFRRALLFAVIDAEPALGEFFGHEHNERIAKFRTIDTTVAALTRDLIRSRLAGGIPTDQVQHDIPKAELGILRKEIGKKTRHIPVRQLLGRIPNLLPRLKPCVLMSPLSVAQYLEASHALFDVVIFDEASQIPVWDAVGAIARGKQLIVVGDPKQLPPTNFFNASDESDSDNTDINQQQDLESILDELMTNGLRHKRLKWHYRSRHESLITFSNRHYYDNELLTFPSPDTKAGGVQFKYLPLARYDKGKSRSNLIEAKALVDELVRRLSQSVGLRRSYGVVTFSQAQQALVENLLDEERRKYPEIEVHFGDQPPVVGEPVFVKNLESVQGDERDVILFSICYGPDETGRVSMNFGPLNREGGHRRLNVAITRAKHEVLVFSSLRADQIDLTRTRARGVRDIKYFLDYAERGPKALNSGTSATADAEYDSEFEKMVADRIRAAGYEVHYQVGCSEYRIDLGVIDPRAPGRYLLGVECDGATYHRAATARDRDKLRQSVLEDLGWTLYRIWSTDWWHDPEAEVAKVVSRLADLAK